MPRWFQRIATVVVLLLALGFFFASWAIQQTRQVPEFYTRATASLPESTADASRHLKADVQQLQSDVSKLGSWKASFSDDEINAWMIEELPKKFPRLLAKGASDPRIVIAEDRLFAAVRYKNHRIDTVVSCELEVKLTEQPNLLALHVQNLRAGALPLPLGKFLNGITKEAAKGEIDVRWDVTESGPIALVTVPSEHPRYLSSPVLVESVQLVDGGLKLAGHTGPLAHQSYTPLGPVYRFASYRPGEKRNRKSSQLSSTADPSSGEKLR